MLSDVDILNAIVTKRLIVEPYDSTLINPNSLDVRLGPDIKRVVSDHIDPNKETQWSVVPRDADGSYWLHPGELYLAHTIEYTELNDVVAIMYGKSSLARLGISVIQAAGLGDVGFKGQWTLEITVVKRTKLYQGMRIAQLIFFETDSPALKKYSGKYLGQIGATPAKIK